MAASQNFVTIAASGTTSTAVKIPNDSAVLSIQTPAALTGTTLTVQGTQNGSDYGDVYLDGVILTISVTTSKVYQISPRATLGLASIRLVSGSTESAARTILVSTARVV